MTRLLVTGASGILGGYLVREARDRGLSVVGWSSSGDGGHDAVPLEDAGAAARAFDRVLPDVVIHAAAIASVAICAQEPERAHAVNTAAAHGLAERARASNARFVFVSTDLVFDGTHAPYREDAIASPLSVYGRTKADAEARVLPLEACVARLPLLFGPSLGAKRGFFDATLESLRSGREVTGFVDEFRTPLSFLAAARALLVLATSPETGIVHLPGPERMSRHALVRRLANVLGVPTPRIREGSRRDVPGEPRPFDTSLATTRASEAVRAELTRSFEEACAAMQLS